MNPNRQSRIDLAVAILTCTGVSLLVAELGLPDWLELLALVVVGLGAAGCLVLRTARRRASGREEEGRNGQEQE